MKVELTLYTRKDCCLCEEMKEIVRRVAGSFPLALQELDVDSSAELQEKYGDEVPVLFINGRKAFKYRVSAKELESRLSKERQGS
ncbi:MAG TPA: glutaredoxin family protein [Candidatus Binatia bacterium]